MLKRVIPLFRFWRQIVLLVWRCFLKAISLFLLFPSFSKIVVGWNLLLLSFEFLSSRLKFWPNEGADCYPAGCMSLVSCPMMWWGLLVKTVLLCLELFPSRLPRWDRTGLFSYTNGIEPRFLRSRSSSRFNSHVVLPMNYKELSICCLFFLLR